MTPYLPSLLSWYVSMLVAGLIGLPWAFRLFRRLPDHGYAFTKTLGLLLGMFLFWLLASIGIVKNDNSGLLLAVLLAGGSGYALLGRSGWAELRAWIDEQKQAVLAIEIFFLACFVGWAWIRSINPDIYGTEKPMELMFLNSVLRSPALPPLDAWLSGHAISYYYFGYFQMASLARLTGTPMAVAFNLAHALIFALTALGSLGLVMNLAALVRSGRADVIHRPSPRLLESFWVGLLGPLMILLVSNFYGALELLHDNGLLAQAQVPTVWYSSRANDAAPAGQPVRPAGVAAGTIGFWQWLDLKELTAPAAAPTGEFQWSLPNWFFAARVIHDRNLTGQETEAIDEVPAFSFLLADLHPHVLALPFVFLALILALDWLLYAREAAGRIPLGSDLPWTAWDRILFSGVILGALLFLNTWDFPIYWFLTILAVFTGTGLVHGMRSFRGWWGIARLGLALLGISLLLYFPFFLTFQSQAGGILPNVVYPSRFQQTLVMFGPVLLGAAFFLGWLAFRVRTIFDRKAAWTIGVGVVLALLAIWALLVAAGVMKSGSAVLLDTGGSGLSPDRLWGLLLQRRLVDSLTTLFGAALIGLAGGAAVGAWKAIARKALAEGEAPDAREPEPAATDPEPELPALEDGVAQNLHNPAVWMAVLMTLTGALLLIGPEFVYLRDNFGTRMNTLFKFYFQIWVLWGSVSAFALWYLLRSAGRWMSTITAVGMGAAILAGLVYLPGGLAARTNNFSSASNLDGLAYFARNYPSDWAAIQWLDQNPTGAPVILEGTRGAYWVEGRSSRFSMATGLPTVIGWVNHEAQWRGKTFEQFAGREADIRTIYQTRDWNEARALLDRYQVDYVIVTSLEQEWYHPIFAQKFDAHLHRVFESGDVIIYGR